MLFRYIDKLFDKLKVIISFVNFVFIALSIFMFVYWLFVIAKITLPDFITSFATNLISIFSIFIPNSKLSEIPEIVPVFVSILLCLFSYLVNSLMTFVEVNHQKYKKSVDNYKKELEYTINTQLHNDFLNALKKTTFLILKFKISLVRETSYLTDFEDSDIDIKQIENNIINTLLSRIHSSDISEKGNDNGQIYIISSNIEHSKELFNTIVTQVSSLVREYSIPKLKVNFSCVSEIFDDPNDVPYLQKYLTKILSLNIFGKILVTPKFHLHFKNLYPNMYNFTVMGDYNLSENSNVNENIILYSLTKK